jgi:hypothetical protein
VGIRKISGQTAIQRLPSALGFPDSRLESSAPTAMPC